MKTVSINRSELQSIELFRVALSENSDEQRVRAIMNARHGVISREIAMLRSRHGPEWVSDVRYAELVQWVAQSSVQRDEAFYEFSLTAQRYEAVNERKLNIAEHIGKLVWQTIQDKRFEGAQTNCGILEQVRDYAKKAGVSGARDKDTLRKLWDTYRGVVHLGMSMDYCEDNPNQELKHLQIAEQFRRSLSENCPKGTSKPYVDPETQISFVYLSSA